MGRTRRLAGTVALTVAGVAVAGWAVAASPAAAEAPAVYSILGRADAFSAEYVQPGVPVFPEGQVLFFSPTTASSSLGSLETPRAFAAAPFPGDFVVSGPGTLNGLSGTSLPPYPTYVYAEYPTVPDGSLDQGPIALKATTRQTETSASAALRGFDDGQEVGFTRSSATSRSRLEGDGTSVGESTALVEGITLPGGLYIGQVRSTVLVKRPADGGELTRTTQTTISGATVGGVPVTITPEGLEVGKTGTPAPLADATALTALLEQDGVRVGLIPSVTSPDGVVSSALAITLVRNQRDQAPIQVNLLFGRASASAAAAVNGAATGGVAPGASPTSGGTVGGTGDGISGGTAGGLRGATADGIAATLPTTAGLGTVPVGVPGATTPTGLQVAPVSVFSAPRLDSDWFYLVLVLASVVAVGSTVVVRRTVPALLPDPPVGA
jgi:hypothetical protein